MLGHPQCWGHPHGPTFNTKRYVPPCFTTLKWLGTEGIACATPFGVEEPFCPQGQLIRLKNTYKKIMFLRLEHNLTT